jgi:hypothetical protein
VADHGPSLVGGFCSLFMFFQCLLRDDDATATSWSKNKVPRPILAPVVLLELAEGAWSCVPRISWDSVVFVGVISCMGLLIYKFHL